MRSEFDRRVVPAAAVDFVRACQARVPCRLGGGAVLAGGWLGHRLSRDLDLFVEDASEHRLLVQCAAEAARASGAELGIVRDAGSFVRARLTAPGVDLEVDFVHDPLPHLGADTSIEGIQVSSEDDLRASKLTCILSRSEPRDLVDLLFLDRVGLPPELDLPLALQKDGGIDPAVLAWLLGQFPVEPLPQMLVPLTVDELTAWREELASRMRTLALEGGEGSSDAP